jgi:hypothetical protein
VGSDDQLQGFSGRKKGTAGTKGNIDGRNLARLQLLL